MAIPMFVFAEIMALLSISFSVGSVVILIQAVSPGFDGDTFSYCVEIKIWDPIKLNCKVSIIVPEMLSK